MRPHHDVVVVGGGPVGVGLALDLWLRGVSRFVLERRAELSRIPKGQGLSQRTMEHMRRWGVAARACDRPGDRLREPARRVLARAAGP